MSDAHTSDRALLVALCRALQDGEPVPEPVALALREKLERVLNEGEPLEREFRSSMRRGPGHPVTEETRAYRWWLRGYVQMMAKPGRLTSAAAIDRVIELTKDSGDKIKHDLKAASDEDLEFLEEISPEALEDMLVYLHRLSHESKQKRGHTAR